ncbi:MAG TPA: Trm112 family protein [Candidatus Nanoarchaeia archaeon]|nr:Trm112 family protein [Candidatus Nanoarchaeia archaeon]
MMIQDNLFKVLACPSCKASLKYGKDKTTLVCVKCAATYPIRKGIPVLLPLS